MWAADVAVAVVEVVAVAVEIDKNRFIKLNAHETGIRNGMHRI